jgi:hypothetical protein
MLHFKITIFKRRISIPVNISYDGILKHRKVINVLFTVNRDENIARLLFPIRRGFPPGFVNYIKGALDSQQQVNKFTSYLSMFGGSLRVLLLLPPLKLVAMI